MDRPLKRRLYRLTPRVCHQLRPGRHGDGFGLYLDVRPTGTRAFVHRIVINGRRRDIGLGPFPVVTLAEAREAALENLRLRRQGVDPLAHRLRKRGAPTVRELLEKVIEARERSWRGAQTQASWRRCFKRCFKQYVFPSVGDTPVDRVTIEDVTRIVEPHWHGRGSAGYLVRQRLDVLFRHAVLLKHRAENPAHQLLDVLLPVQREPAHHPSLPHVQVRSALAALRASSAPEGVKDILPFIILTAARLSEATGAVWSEVDFGKCMWGVPAPRMKAGHPHHVPLALQALSLLHRVRHHGDPVFVFRFRSSDGKTRPVSGESLNYWLRRLGVRDSDGRWTVVHGFRSSFRSWALEVAHAPGEAAEAALAHRGTATVRAYLRDGPLFNARVDLMQTWADYVDPRPSS